MRAKLSFRLKHARERGAGLSTPLLLFWFMGKATTINSDLSGDKNLLSGTTICLLFLFPFLSETGNDEGLFAINKTSGEISLNGTIDAEKTDFFRITVRVIQFLLISLHIFKKTSRQSSFYFCSS